MKPPLLSLLNAVTAEVHFADGLYPLCGATGKSGYKTWRIGHCTRMADSGRRSAIIGCVGVLCLAVYWAAMFFPQTANILPESSLGKFVVFGIFLAGVPLTIVAAIGDSNWWWVAVAAGAITLWDIYTRFRRVLT